MEFKDFWNTFVQYNKRIYKKLIIVSILLFYFVFLIYFNHFRVILGYELDASWAFGIIYALITTLGFVFVMDILRVLLLLKSSRE